MLYYGLQKIAQPHLSDAFPIEGLTENILALNDIAVILTAPRNKIVHCSKSVGTILGISARDVVKNGWHTVISRIHPDDQRLLKKKLRPDLRKELRRMTPAERLECSFNYTFRIRCDEDLYKPMALENQSVRLGDTKSPWLQMSVLKNISPYGPKDRMILTISKKAAACGWEKLFEKDYFLKAAGFTVRETQIMNLVAEGLSSRGIADKLYISVETVRCHRKKVMQKTGCKTSAELVSVALREDII